MTTELWIYIRDVMMTRFPGLSMRRMSELAGVAGNTVGKIKNEAHVPKAETLLALAQRWGRTDEERMRDYRAMMERAGKVMPEEFHITDDEKEWLKRYRRLSPQQREMAQRFFNAYGAGETIEVLSRGLRPFNPIRPTPAETFREFLDLLEQVSDLTPGECMVMIAEALRTVQEKGRPDYSQNSSAEQ